MTKHRLLKRFCVHAVLLAGCAVFAFPFVWLVGTSLKRNEELAAFPPRWVPRVPWHSERSPFVDAGFYGPVEAPAQLAAADWERLRPAIEAALLDAGGRRLEEWRARPTASAAAPSGASAAAQTPSAWAEADRAAFLEQLKRGLWVQAREVVPDAVWRQPDSLPGFLGRAVTAEMVARTWNNVVRTLGVGEVKVRHADNDLVQPESAGAWEPRGPAQLDPAVLEGESCLRVGYDFSRAETFTLSRTLRLPVAVGDLRALNIPIHSDESWHRLEVTVESGGRVFRAERPLWMDIRTWQEAEYTFKAPAYRGSRAILLEADGVAATNLADPHTVRLTLTWRRSGRLRAAFDKYIDSYRWALRYIPFDAQLRNTVILVALNVAGQLFACSLAAYAFARLSFYGRNFLFGLLLATMMLPAQVTMIPNFILWKSLGWYDTLRPLWAPAWFGGAFFIFLLRQFFMTIPKELEDAAKIDGCGFFGIYWRIMLPLAAPALATVAIFSFMGAWNEFVQPLVYLSDERLFPLSLGLNQFRQEQAAEWPWLMAAATMMMLPVIAVFFFCQRYFIQGVTLTGLKG
ncbi:MAG: ABC transporter permease subunit [Planctomycetes bacterium]|nr:ABC transporter permease subunit [Planctomycetota bacterium]